MVRNMVELNDNELVMVTGGQWGYGYGNGGINGGGSSFWSPTGSSASGFGNTWAQGVGYANSPYGGMGFGYANAYAEGYSAAGPGGATGWGYGGYDAGGMSMFSGPWGP